MGDVEELTVQKLDKGKGRALPDSDEGADSQDTGSDVTLTDVTLGDDTGEVPLSPRTSVVVHALSFSFHN